MSMGVYLFIALGITLHFVTGRYVPWLTIRSASIPLVAPSSLAPHALHHHFTSLMHDQKYRHFELTTSLWSTKMIQKPVKQPILSKTTRTNLQ